MAGRADLAGAAALGLTASSCCPVHPRTDAVSANCRYRPYRCASSDDGHTILMNGGQSMAQPSQKFLKSIEKRSASGTRVRSAEGSAVGLTRSAAQDAKRLAVETTRRASRLPSRNSAKPETAQAVGPSAVLERPLLSAEHCRRCPAGRHDPFRAPGAARSRDPFGVQAVASRPKVHASCRLLTRSGFSWPGDAGALRSAASAWRQCLFALAVGGRLGVCREAGRRKHRRIRVVGVGLRAARAQLIEYDPARGRDEVVARPDARMHDAARIGDRLTPVNPLEMIDPQTFRTGPVVAP